MKVWRHSQYIHKDVVKMFSIDQVRTGNGLVNSWGFCSSVEITGCAPPIRRCSAIREPDTRSFQWPCFMSIFYLYFSTSVGSLLSFGWCLRAPELCLSPSSIVRAKYYIIFIISLQKGAHLMRQVAIATRCLSDLAEDKKKKHIIWNSSFS